MMTFNNISQYMYVSYRPFLTNISQYMYVSYRPFLTRVTCITQLPVDNNTVLLLVHKESGSY